MAKKRAPGAGRKPRGEFRGKTATLTTRITPETRAALDRAAQKSGRSLSQEVEHRLDLSIRRDRDLNHQRHIRALAEAIALLTQQVERATGKCWRDDPFTGEALRHAIEFLISHYAPHGAIEVPAPVEAAAARVPPAARDSSLTPIGVGNSQSGLADILIEMDLDQGGRLSRALRMSLVPTSQMSGTHTRTVLRPRVRLEACTKSNAKGAPSMKGHIRERSAGHWAIVHRRARSSTYLNAGSTTTRLSGAVTHEATRHDHFPFPRFLPNSVQPWP